MDPKKIKLSANIAALQRVDLIGGREQAHRGGHESTSIEERKVMRSGDHVGQLCKFLCFTF